MALRDKLTTTNEQILAGKKAVADALIQVGITAVEPNPNVPDKYETFQSYADKIKRLMISNSLILEYNITGSTKLMHTVFLPVYNVPINDVTIEIINSDTANTYSHNSVSTLATNSENSATTTDVFGNIVDNGTIIHEETQEEKDYRAYLELLEAEAVTPSPQTLEDLYSFTVDWGDGSEPEEFISLEETPTAWYHTYEKGGTYNVTVNGVFKYLYSYAGWNGQLTHNGQYVYDTDGAIIQSMSNHSTRRFLTKVIAWGNTQFTNCNQGLCSAYKLQSIPMYDTTESFSKVTSFASMFYNAQSFKQIPYDSNTERGMFTNSPEVTSFSRTFEYVKFGAEIPPLLIANCPKVTDMAFMFESCSIKGNLPDAMFLGLPLLTNIQSLFSATSFDGALSSTLFDECPNITNMQQTFNNCIFDGGVPEGLFKNLNKCNNIIGTFFNDNQIKTALGKDTLSGLTADNLSAHTTFKGCTNIPGSIEEGFFSHMAGDNIWAPQMFAICSALTSISSTLLEEISHFANVENMFALCTHITSPCPSFPSNGDFNSYETLQKYLGIFAGCSRMADYSTMPKELGGEGDRLFPQYHTGAICLDDGTFVEIEDFVYDPDNKPIGFCVHSDDDGNIVMAFNHYYGKGVNSASFSWKNVPDSPIYQAYLGNITPYTGEEVCKQFYEWSGYTSNKAMYPAFEFCENYKPANNDRIWWLPIGLSQQRYCAYQAIWMRVACEKIIVESNGDYTSENCYAPSNGHYITSCQFAGDSGLYRIVCTILITEGASPHILDSDYRPCTMVR